MFERFTGRARQVVVLAQEEARGFCHDYIGTEHLLLGLLRVDEGVGGRVLRDLRVDVEGVRATVETIVGRGERAPAAGAIPFSPRAKKVLEFSLREALGLGHNYIGTEHILLGLAREGEGVAYRILLDYDADSERIRESVLAVLGPRVQRRRTWAGRRLRRAPLPLRTGPTRWEYRIERSDDIDVDRLNSLGDDGWELVDVVPGEPPALVLKRPRAEGSAAESA